VGDVAALGAFSVRVLAENEGRPTRFSVLFDRSLDDSSLAILIRKACVRSRRRASVKQ
jgi:hypothetical protein